jgi:hypothetical protein
LNNPKAAELKNNSALPANRYGKRSMAIEVVPQFGERRDEVAAKQVGMKQPRAAVSACSDKVEVVEAVKVALAKHG